MSLMDKVFSEGPLAEASEKSPGRLVPDYETSNIDDPYQDYDRLRSVAKDFLQDISASRRAFERLWFESFLFYLGNQWLAYDQGKKSFRQRNLKKWIPKPYTNRYASTADTIMGVIEAMEVRPTAWPSTDDADDIASASVAHKVLRIIDEEINHKSVKERLSPLVVLNADAFALPYYDKNDNSLGETFIPYLECNYCHYEGIPTEFEETCPACGMISATSETMNGETFPFGKLKVAVMSPLEVYFNMEADSMEEVREWLFVKAYPLDVIKNNWPKTGQYVQATANVAQKEGTFYQDILTYITQDSAGASGKQAKNVGHVLTHFKMPCDEYPEGLVNVQASDGTILEVGPSPFKTDGPDGSAHYNPLIKFSYRTLPQRVYSKSPMFDLISKQKQRNRLESLIELCTMKGVYHTWLLPMGSSISQLTGEPAQHVRWTPTGTNGAKPEVINQPPFPALLLEWLHQIDADFEEIAGTFDALKGNTPRGVSAGYAIQLLTEKSYGRLGPVMNNWQSGWTDLYKILITLFKQNVTESRIYRIQGESGDWEIEKFLGADIKGSIDIRMEGGANRPKTKLAEQALVETLSKLGVLNPKDPTEKYAIADLFGMAHMLGTTQEDYRYTAQEWEEFKVGDIPMVRLVVDNHIVHIMDHQKRAKTGIFKVMPPEQQDMWQKHIKDHIDVVNQQAQGAAPPDKKPGDIKPAGSKANEQGDQTMNQIRDGGNSTMGSGGKN